jgi:hypothetical protein
VQGNPRSSHLGQPEASLENYGKALAIAQKLAASRPVLEILARSHYKMGTLQYWALGARPSNGQEKR